MNPFKPFVAVLAAAIVVAVIALFLDSPIVLVVSVALIVADGIGIFLLGAKAAHEGSCVIVGAFALGARTAQRTR